MALENDIISNNATYDNVKATIKSIEKQTLTNNCCISKGKKLKIYMSEISREQQIALFAKQQD